MRLFLLFGLLLWLEVVAGEGDYYTVLGIKKGATLKEIKKAFRTLALKYHPDKSKDPNCVDKFRAVAEAYEVLRDPERRKQYENMGHSSFYQNTGYKPNTADFKDLFKDFEDLFKEFGHMEEFFKQHFANHKIQTEAAGGIFNFATDIDFGKLFEGDENVENFHEHMHQNGAEILKDIPGTETDGKKCKTVTKKVGNSVTTYTQCETATTESSESNPALDAHARAHQAHLDAQKKHHEL